MINFLLFVSVTVKRVLTVQPRINHATPMLLLRLCLALPLYKYQMPLPSLSYLCPSPIPIMSSHASPQPLTCPSLPQNPTPVLYPTRLVVPWTRPYTACPQYGHHISFYTAEATNAILYGLKFTLRHYADMTLKHNEKTSEI